MGALIFLVLLGSLAIVQRWEVKKSGSGPGPGQREEVVRRQLTANAPGNQVSMAAISRDGKYLAYNDKAPEMHLLQIDSLRSR